MKKGNIKVLYIAGRGRSGSTILDNLLGQVDGFFSAGEIRLGGRRLAEDSYCGCGGRLTECDVWRGVLKKAFGNANRAAAGEMLHLVDMGARPHQIPQMLMSNNESLKNSRMGKCVEVIEKLYGAIADATGCEVIVDSSKYPPYAYLLGRVPMIDLYVVHLIRDSRAVAYSWIRQKQKNITQSNDPLYRRSVNPVQSSIKWSLVNLSAELLLGRRRYMRIRYEDIMVNPWKTMRRILDLVGKTPPAYEPLPGNRINLVTTHTISGNPKRFQTGTVELRLDDEFKSKMRPSSSRLVTALTWPLLYRYGYIGGKSRSAGGNET
ncbi:MAG: sulfotransferase family protein [bacterium]|nr:MAG: sulfotransferase family protein [bacterium]